MPRNVEIKARARDLEALARLAESLAGSPPEVLVQQDTFFPVERGRLKLRRFDADFGELIFYRRPDSEGPKTSAYDVAAVADPDRLKEVLAAALGTAGVVRKRRRVYLVGRTRVHLDEVDGLGPFLEFEVVLGDGESAEDGARAARDLMRAFGVREEDLVAGAYVDLLTK
jgi:predicted adenylyl cyclase CyaB